LPGYYSQNRDNLTGVNQVAVIFIEILQKEFNLSENEINLLSKTTRQLKKDDRRAYFGQLKRREKDFKSFMKRQYETMTLESQAQWLESVVQSLLDRGGEPDLADNLAMSVIGRIPVYNRMRERAEKEGIRLKTLANFGGMSTVIMLVGVITALVLYLTAK